MRLVMKQHATGNWHYLILCILLVGTGCSSGGNDQSDSRDFVLDEKDLIPEGTAFNTRTNTIYIGSVYRQKIVEIASNGKITSVIGPNDFGELSPLGMEMDNERNTLWVNVARAPVVHPFTSDQSKTTIMSFDMSSRKRGKDYAVIDTDGAFLNDLTVTASGDVYATETIKSRIYRITSTTDELELYLELDAFTFPNGITWHAAANSLFVATGEGIVRVSLDTKHAALLEAAPGVNAKNIDGLAIHEDYFIGHQSSSVSKFHFNSDTTKIIKSTTLDSGPEFDSSTTGEIANGYYYFIVNSQLGSGIYRESRIIKHVDSLEKVIVRKLKL